MNQEAVERSRREALTDALELRAIRVGFVLQTAVALLLSFIPLFDVLGFERAFASGLLAAPVSAAVGISMVRSARARGGEDLARVASHAIGISLLMLVPTLVAGVVVELVSQPCDQQQGILFLLLIAGGNVVFATAIGTVAAVAFPRKFWPGLVAALVLLGFLGAALYRLYSEPQIYVYSMPFGYWPGSLYDEDVEVRSSLWIFRGVTLLWAFAAIAIARAFSEPRDLKLSFVRPRLSALLGAGTLLFLAITTYRTGEALGFARTRETIERALSRHVETEHFEIFIAPNVTPDEVERLKEDHELRYEQLVRFFGFGPKGRIKSFVYASERQKRRLMGAAATQISRPWEREIHINGFGVPHPVLKHELAHVFAGEIGTGLFKVPVSGLVFVNMGIVEGTAVAADWPANELSIHGWTRAMRALHLAPDLTKMLDPAGFWALSSSRAYTVAGSFVRWLVDTQGIERFSTLYASNDFEHAYGRSLPSLIADWSAYIDALPLSENDLLMAEQRFKRPSIFQKVCAHKAAALSRQGYQRLASGDVEGGIERLEQLVSYAPNNVQPLLDIADTLARAGHTEEARRYVRRALEAPDLAKKSAAEAEEALAGLDWRAGAVEAARRGFEKVRALHVSASSDRLQTARLAALDRPQAEQEILRGFLLGEVTGGLALVRLGELVRTHPEDALARYLYGRQLENAGAFPEGVVELQAALSHDLPSVLVDEATMTLGRLLLRGGHPEEAAQVFRRLSSPSSSAREATEKGGDVNRDVVRLNGADWAERAELIARRAGPEPSGSDPTPVRPAHDPPRGAQE